MQKAKILMHWTIVVLFKAINHESLTNWSQRRRKFKSDQVDKTKQKES